jgi:hypothetical protein
MAADPAYDAKCSTSPGKPVRIISCAGSSDRNPNSATQHQTINVGPDGTIEMSADDAQYLIRAGWTKLAEWTRDEAA